MRHTTFTCVALTVLLIGAAARTAAASLIPMVLRHPPSIRSGQRPFNPAQSPCPPDKPIVATNPSSSAALTPESQKAYSYSETPR